jgi:hypothetical protein
MAGPVGIGSVAAGIALAGGGTTTLSFGLWLIIGLRSIAAVVLVRSQLRRGKGRPYRAWPVHLIDVAAGAGAIGAAATGIVPWLGAGVIAALTPFGFWSLARPAVPTVVVGIHQVALGVLVVAATVVGVRAGL